MTNRIIKSAASTILGLAVLISGVVSATAAGSAQRKTTRFFNLTAAPLVVKAGGTVTVRAQLCYINKQNKCVPLDYKSVPVEFWALNRPLGSSSTVKGGWVKFEVPIAKNSRPGRVDYRLKFNGDQELWGCWIQGSFTIVK